MLKAFNSIVRLILNTKSTFHINIRMSGVTAIQTQSVLLPASSVSASHGLKPFVLKQFDGYMILSLGTFDSGV